MTVEQTEILNADAGITSAPVDEAADMGAAWDRVMVQNGADRGEGGQFASPDNKASPPVGEEGAGAPADPSTVAVVAPAPAHLPQAIKADWDKIPESARNAITAHQAEMDRKFGEIGEQYGRVKPIAEKLTAATTQFPEFRGMSPDQIAQGALELAAVQSALNRGPESAVSTIMEVARTYNILPQLAAAFNAQPPAESAQLVTGLQQKIANLEAKLSQVGSPDTIRETVSTTLKERETETLVQSFSAGKEHWTDVEAFIPSCIKHVMENGLATSPQEILDKAYDMAINANPVVREKVRAAEVAKATAAAADPKRAADARKAASINVKSSSSGNPRPMTFDESAAAAYDRAMAS